MVEHTHRAARSVPRKGGSQVTTHSEAQSGAYFAEPGIPDPLLLASLLGGMDAALFAVDRDGRVTHWNQEAERLLGWSRAEAVGRPGLGGWAVRDCDAADVHGRLLAVALGPEPEPELEPGREPELELDTGYEPRLTGDLPAELPGGCTAPDAPDVTDAADAPGTPAPATRQVQEFPLVTKGGNRLLVRAQTAAVQDREGRAAGAYCAFSEVHAQLDLERRIALSDALLGDSSWAVLLVDADLRTVAVNEPATRVLAVSPVDMLGEPLAEFFGSGLEELESALEHTLAGNAPVEPVELWVTLHEDGSHEDEHGDPRGGLPGGRRRCWLSGFLPLGSPLATDPSPLGVAWVFQDVTRTRRQTQETARQRFRDSQLSRAGRAAAECEEPLEAAGLYLDFALAGFAEHALLDVAGPLPATAGGGQAGHPADGHGTTGGHGAGGALGARLVRAIETPGPVGAVAATAGLPVRYRDGHPALEALERGVPVRATGGVPFPDPEQPQPGPPWAVVHKWPREAVHALCVALRSRGRQLGVVTFLRGPGRRGFDRTDAAYAEDVALRIAAAVDLAAPAR
jgi:PAS domain-containing protein